MNMKSKNSTSSTKSSNHPRLTTVILDRDGVHVLRPSEKTIAEPFQVGDHFAWVAQIGVVLEGEAQYASTRETLVIYGTVEGVQGDLVVGTCFSVGCPEGEYGDTRIPDIQARLSSSEFAYAKDYGWPNDFFAQRCVVQGLAP